MLSHVSSMDAKEHSLPQPAEPTKRLRTALDEFIAYVRMRYSAETVRQYLRNLERFMEWVAGRPGGLRIHNITDLTIEALSDYQRWLNTVARSCDGSALGQPEKEARLYPLKAFLRFCHRKGFLAKDLRRFVIVPAREHKAHKPLLSVEETIRLLESPDPEKTVGIRDRAMLELAYSGLRAGELLGLTLEDLDIEADRLFIRQGKGDKDRVVPMTAQARHWLKLWLECRREFAGVTDTRLLFVSRSGKPICRRNLAVALVKYARRAKLPVSVAPHDLRRITATHLAANGAPLRYIQALLGHTSLKVTTKYVRLTDAHIKTEYERTHPSCQRTRHIVAVA